jgi:hypothetical protein
LTLPVAKRAALRPLEKLGGEDSNPQLQGQNLPCCRLHHPRMGGVIVTGATLEAAGVASASGNSWVSLHHLDSGGENRATTVGHARTTAREYPTEQPQTEESLQPPDDVVRTAGPVPS